MASRPARPLHEQPAPNSTRGAGERGPSTPLTDEQVRLGHKERVRVSLAWALDEYASTLEKLAR